MLTPRNAEDFIRWVINALPRETLRYHEGLLAIDRRGKTRRAQTLDQMARVAHAASLHGEIQLSQRRRRPHDKISEYDYIATKLTNPFDRRPRHAASAPMAQGRV